MGMKGLYMRRKNLKQRLGLLDIHVVTCYGIWKSKKKKLIFSLNPFMPEQSSDCSSEMVNVL